MQIGTLGGEPGKATFTLDRKPKPKPSKTTPTPTKPTPDGEEHREARTTEGYNVALEDARLGQPGQALADAAGPQVADSLDGLEILDAGGQQLLQ